MKTNSLASRGGWMKKRHIDRFFLTACLIPAIILITIVVLIPVLQAVQISLMEYKFISKHAPTWNNFGNYKALFQSGDFTVYLKNTSIYIFFAVSISFGLALFLSLLLNSKIKGRNVMRGMIFMSWTIPSVVNALLWTWLFQPQYGVLNYIFNKFGWLANENQTWVQHPQLAMVTIIIAAVWAQTPYMMVMLLAGLQSVSSELVEAAKIDGAGRFSILRYVQIPSIRPVIDTAVLISVMTNSQMYTVIYNMTQGGPMNKTTTFAIAAYQEAFTGYNLGLGAATGVVWLIIIGLIVFLYKTYSERKISGYL